MFLGLAGRLSAARTGKSATAFLAQTSTANRASDATLTLHNNNNNNSSSNNNNNSTFQGRRCFCVSGGGVGSGRLWKRTLRDQDTSAFAPRGRTHWDRVTGAAPGLSEPAQSADYLDLIRQPAACVTGRHNSTEESLGNVLFTGSWRVPSPRCAGWTTQTRASSTKRGDTGHDKENLMEVTAKTSEKPEGAKLIKTQQLKKVFKEYGAVGVSFHICISLTSLGMFYLLLSSGIDMAAVLCKLGFSETVVRSKMAAGTSTFVLAYAIHKVFAPARISITLVSVPLIVRYFRKIGLFKPPTAAP